jgi:AAA+ ATPase superfamily predicted ATPase
LLSLIGKDVDNYIIMLDEVQELARVSIHLLRVLANIFNIYPNIIFIFTGSMSGLIRTLLESTHDSPLYSRSPAVIYIKPFNIETSKAFLIKGFEEYMRDKDKGIEVMDW